MQSLLESNEMDDLRDRSAQQNRGNFDDSASSTPVRDEVPQISIEAFRWEGIQAPRGGLRSPVSIVLSAFLHVGVVLIVSTVRYSSTRPELPDSLQHVTLIAPSVRVRPAISSPKPRMINPEVLKTPVIASRRFEVPQPKLTVPKLDIEPPQLAMTPQILPASPQRIPAAPPSQLKTDNFLEVQTAAPDSGRNARIESAGFSGQQSSTPNVRRGAISESGFSAAATVHAPAEGHSSMQTALGAFGNAFDTAKTVPATKQSVTTAVGGFGNAALASATSPRTVAIAKSDFETTQVKSPPRSPEVENLPPAMIPVEILSKPRPLYTDEARRLKLEGEVLLELLFPATGAPRAIRLVRGLGHGLDESAIAAAQGIRFRPAQKAGMPVDSTTVVHIVFQLAF